jgi:hypothetical protein
LLKWCVLLEAAIPSFSILRESILVAAIGITTFYLLCPFMMIAVGFPSRWKSKVAEEATWEDVLTIKSQFPNFS